MRHFEDFLSIRPNKIVAYCKEITEYKAPVKKQKSSCTMSRKELAKFGFYAKEKKEKSGHNFELSKKARVNIQEKINWLFYFAKSKTISTTSGKIVKDFKINFITLTLPSPQKHSSDFLTKNCLNQFLQELRQKSGLRNYVWRLEYQKNGNLHYHIVTDSYVSQNDIRNYWNRILEKYGYVTAYQKKMKSLSFSDYHLMMCGYGKNDISKNSQSFAKGIKSNWFNPNSTDTIFVTQEKRIGGYISKYFGKNEQSIVKNKYEDQDENSKFSRLWYCSESLSKCKKVTDLRILFDFDLFGELFAAADTKTLVYDYCSVIYFDIAKLPHKIANYINLLLNNYKIELNYS